MIWTMKKRGYRVFQRVMKNVAKVLPFPYPVLLTGPGSVRELAVNLKIRGIGHVLVVTDKILMELKLLDSFLASLDEQGVRYTIFDDVQPNPTIENVEDGRRAYKANRCDGIVGFGGGSPIDCAKVIAARVGNPFLPVRLMKGLFKVVLPIPPFFCVPTTAGTGSEATIVAVITDAKTHEKFAINDLKLVPRIAALDPELMVGLPPHITSTTGMDALTHAVEAYIGLNGSDFTNENAENATRLIFGNLEKAYRNGSDLEARNNMALASFFAGAAFTRAYVGYVHAIAHAMGGLYGVPHGLANAIILPYVLDNSRKEAEQKLARLATVAGLGSTTDSAESLSYMFINAIKEMNKTMDIPTSIKELKESDIPLIAKRAVTEAHPDYPVPRILTLEECELLVRELLP
jgi:alcohol dehydrogenase